MQAGLSGPGQPGAPQNLGQVRGRHRAAGAAGSAGSAATAGPRRAPAVRAAERLLTQDVPALRQQWVLTRAQQQIITGCMHGLGYRYLPLSAGPQPAAGTVTEDAAGPPRRASYGLLRPGPGADREDAYVRALPAPQQARYTVAWQGPRGAQGTLRLPGCGGTVVYGTGGCVSTARRQLFGSVAAFVRDFYLSQYFRLESGRFLGGYQPYTAALGRWQRCMAGSGRRYASPAAAMQAIAVLAARLGTSPAALRAAQHAVARADASCGRRTGLRLRRRAGLAAWASRLPGAALAQLRAIWLTRQQAVRAARRKLAAAGRLCRPAGCGTPVAGSSGPAPAGFAR